jgi:hypothetical protein
LGSPEVDSSWETQVRLENFLKIGQLKTHAPDGPEIEGLLIAARRNLRDARVTGPNSAYPSARCPVLPLVSVRCQAGQISSEVRELRQES